MNFKGKVLLEKVMRSLPTVKTIYIGISSKVRRTLNICVEPVRIINNTSHRLAEGLIKSMEDSKKK